MENQRRIWLIDNSASGSNSEQALDLLEETCGDAGFHVAHRTMFPRYELPSPSVSSAAVWTITCTTSSNSSKELSRFATAARRVSMFGCMREL